MGEYNIKVDVEKNRIYVSLSGFFRDLEIKNVVQVFYDEIAKLRAGFDLIDDITTLKPTTGFGISQISRIYLVLKSIGIRRIIRISSDSLAAEQFNEVSSNSGINIQIVHSKEEAEKLLNHKK